MKPNKKAVVFDLDGTVLDTIADIAAAVNRALVAFGFPERTVDETRGFLGNGSLMLIKRATNVFDNEELCLKVRARFREEYEKGMCDLTRPYEGMCGLLSELSEKGIKVAVVTNKDHRCAEPMIKHYFGDSVHICKGVVADNQRKPNPENTLKTLAQFGVTPDEAVFVGDGMADLQVSQNAEIDFVPVGYGYTSSEKLFSECGINPAVDVPALAKVLSEYCGFEIQ